MQQQYESFHEQLGGGAAYAAHAEGSGTSVRVVPLREGERTIGHRKADDDAPAIWDSEPLREAVEQGKLRDPIRNKDTLIVKGEGGKNPHFAMDEQVPPENILGRIDKWTWEEGTGPVGHAQLADEDIAKRIDMGLLEVSGDWLRRLGEYDSDRNGKPVTEVVGLPRIHVLESGAADGASIEIAPETAEALGYNPEADPNIDLDTVEQHASEGDAVRWASSSGGSREPADERYGVVVNPTPDDSERDWMVAVYQPTSDYSGWESRNETQPMSDDTLERVGPDGVDSLPPVSQVVEQDASLLDRMASRVADILRSEDVEVQAESEGEDDAEEDVDEQHSDEPADTGTEADADADSDQTTMPENDTDLHEQLATVRNEKEQLADKNENLESQLAEREDELEETEEQLSDKEERIESLEEEVAPLKELLAEIAAEGSMLNPEKIAETHSTNELVDMLADDADDDQSYSEKMREQMSANLAPRGDPGGEEVDETDEEQLAEANDRAYELISGTEVSQMAGSDLSPAQFVTERKGVDPRNFSSKEQLRAAYENQQQQNAGEN